ncbi:MAG: thioredoxin family protein [Candidatus Omnitrophica bacterium]|nr:thioredoxin family protein [Candidatus Omnitrophota bacterium]
MALTPSTMLALGTKAPAFDLPDVVSGKKVSLEKFSGSKPFLVMFICQHCPYVQHVKSELARLGKDYMAKGVGVVAISSNDAANYPEDAPGKLKAFAQEMKFTFPLLYDETQAVAKAYSAACTPDFFLFDRKRELVYRGQLDDSRPGNGKAVTGKDLRAALDALLEGRPVHDDQKPSIGCNIKWKKGQEPASFA